MGSFGSGPALAASLGRVPRRPLMTLTVLLLAIAGLISMTGGPAQAAKLAATSAIVFDGSPDTGAPPPTLGGYAMQAFGTDSQPTGQLVSGVTGPSGEISFSPQLDHATVGAGWQTWSNGYTGDVYSSSGQTVTVTVPSGTHAFYLYAEPQQFATLNVSATAQDGTTSGNVPVNGEAGAAYFGFYGTGGDTISSITVSTDDPTGFAIGEFGIAAGKLRYVALGDSYSSGEANPPFVKAKGKCDLSRQHAWPELLAAQDNSLQLVGELACSGATTAALESKFKGQPGELETMKPLDPSVVTITIGGNNVGFRSVLENCYLFTFCDKDGSLATASKKISALPSTMPAVYRDVVAHAPAGAQVYVVGYPRLLPLSRHHVALHCPWLSGTVQTKLNDLAVKLNRVLSAAAARAGVHYVPTLNAFSGHELCSASPWVRALQPNNRQYSGHPLLKGQQALANIVQQAIG
jgi:lysophospholipase L1-like esterase